ncbi:aminotransferase class I/II-fold pyridoxal phosphate-dependent enzyme [Enterococcus saccharolyticus]|uniref:Cystathionine gamma-synthase n=1 Tax=Candidatus Enterococcus willemsii TaxID=1857215 RepID=A0ABQ6YXV6_9ENTE|nr:MULTISPECIES: aminotransferase class I/II-fold pyridoxal phosphate-dependent enzyme [Enterococcus]KAF1302432.1 cystathionine gamma-synthase [Enterococcus sp. CU12B]MCD5002614.1 aminotransferase class I/II-fold pyridoxal phosphate-dependent enzyme [Enterococcus saccharolyticus]
MSKHLSTELVQLGNRKDTQNGSISAPIYLSTTYAHPGLGESTGYDYIRTKNPTRDVLEEGLAKLEGGARAIVTSSGMSAIQLVFNYFSVGAKFLVSRDLYGGSFRFFDELAEKGIATFDYFTDLADLTEKITSDVAGIFLETPTNPLMNEVSIREVAKLSTKHEALLIVDNTFLTPLRQRPLEEGADIVVHSGTKYLAGHNDILAGVVVAKDATLGDKLAWLANTTGPTLSAFDSWLFTRSLKTLELRFNQQEKNAQEIAKTLEKHPAIKEVFYVGAGSMISIKVVDENKIGSFLQALEVFSFAESLGGVESLITYPTTQTHADIPQALRESYGLTPDLLRISVGIEHVEDLIADLEQALNA